MWSLEDDLQGMNLSLHVECFEGDERERREEGDDNDNGDGDGDDDENVSRRSVVPDIPAGRFSPDGFLACGDSILSASVFSSLSFSIELV